jgi:hypothetical protein
MSLEAVSDALLERVNSMAREVAKLDLKELDAIAGLLMTMHSQSEELLFQVLTLLALLVQKYKY